MSTPSNSLERWRLVLGRFAKQQLPVDLSRQQQRMEAALDYLYSREYRGRGLREENGGHEGGGDEASQFTIPKWLSEVRTLFPKETVEIIEKHALDRYDMKELLTDAQTLAKLEPNLDLLKTLLSFRGHLKGKSSCALGTASSPSRPSKQLPRRSRICRRCSTRKATR